MGRPEEAGYFIGNDDVKYASTHEVEFWLEMGGWRDIDGTHTGTVDTNTANTYADSAEVARQYSDVPELDASNSGTTPRFSTRRSCGSCSALSSRRT